jgi:hypothetical protein
VTGTKKAAEEGAQGGAEETKQDASAGVSAAVSKKIDVGKRSSAGFATSSRIAELDPEQVNRI